MRRGYAEDKKQEAAVLAAGVPARALYRDDIEDAIKSLRPGDLLVVAGLNALATNRREIRKIVDHVQARGAELVDAFTGFTTAAKGVQALDDALIRIHGAAAMPDVAKAVEMQRKSVRTRTKGRMSKREALIPWRNPALTVEQALALMPGWAKVTAYNNLGSRGLPPGRRRTKS